MSRGARLARRTVCCRPTFLALAISAAAGFGPRAAAAQFTITHSDPVRFPSPTALHFAQGFVDLPSTTVQINPSNKGRPWSLALRSVNPNLAPGKPLTDVQWRVQGAAVWNSLSTSYATVIVRDQGAETVVVEFRLILRWTDLPAYYQTNIGWRASH